MTYKLYPALALCVLAGCGGGGTTTAPWDGETGSGQEQPAPDGLIPDDLPRPGTKPAPAPDRFQSFSTVPADGTYTLHGTGISANLSKDGAGKVIVSTAGAAQPATFVLTNAAGKVVANSLSANGATASFDLRAGDTALLQDTLIIARSKDGATYVVQDKTAGGTYDYQSYGTWMTGAGTDAGVKGAASVGARTLASAIPTQPSEHAAQGHFNGVASGLMTSTAGVPSAISSKIYVQTDFSSLTLESYDTILTVHETGAISATPGLNFKGTGSVSGTTFSVPLDGDILHGSASGAFYGPKAEELGGTFQTSGSGYDYIGAFGAN